jgi:RNA polymerase sigma factor (sigma-70 family)
MSGTFSAADAEKREEHGEDLVRLYLTDIGRHPLLTKEDEVRLAQAMDAGNAAQVRMERDGRELSPPRRRELSRQVRTGQKAKRVFIEANLRLVVSVAKAYQASGVPLLDLIQEGNLGLIHAVGKFDWRRGFRFSTYATWWIRQGITRGIAKMDRTIRLPTDVRRTVRRVRKEQDSLELELGRPATLTELGSTMAMTQDQIVRALNVSTVSVSLSAPVGEDGHTELAELIDLSAPGPEEGVVDRAGREEVARLLDSLSLRERDIVRLRFGFGDDRRRTISQVAVVVGLTPQRVSNIQAQALQKLRRQNDDSQGLLSARSS